MRKLYYILLTLAGFSFIAGCNKMEDDFAYSDIVREGVITPYCQFENNSDNEYASDKLSTKSLINKTTSVDTILCNFLRIEENGGSFSAEDGYTTNWNKAYLSEGTIATVPNATDQTGGLRAVSLHPEQPYNTINKDIRSRMVGWYPRTNNVPENASGTDVSIQFENFTGTITNGTYDNDEKYIGVKFTGLDGSKDIMVSDVRDGSYNNPFKSPENYFTFKHYLSAVRIYAKAERSSQDIGMWGEIDEVIIMGQPTSCVVALPEKPFEADVSSGYGEVVEWGSENAKFPIQKKHIFGEKDNNNPNNTIAEEYPIRLDGNSIEKYLGYSLIRPEQNLRIHVHTNAGIYDVVMPATYNDKNIFKAGYIYNLHLDFKTDGTIFAFLEHEGDEKYYDLTKGEAYKLDSDGDEDVDNDDTELFKNKFSNCYIVYSDPSSTDQDPEGDLKTYDGFCFDATVVGNGDGGILSTGAQTFYPTNAHISPASADILWETSPRLITQVELTFGHVRFKVAKENDGTFKEGNAVIAVYDNNKRILWSWHIWVTDKPEDVSYTEGETEITIMDRNLGATYGDIPNNDADALASYGLYYQWGRKDPSMGPPAWDYSPINMTTAPYYDYSSEEKTAAEVVRFAAPTLKDAVENPMYLIMPTTLTQSYYFNWLYEKIDFLWGNSVTSGNTHKTIYDPCPYGYRVSGGELGDLFAYATNISTTGSYDITSPYGQKVSVPKNSNAQDGEKAVFFFPYAGFKGVDRGLNSLVSSWKYVGQKGDYQSAIVSRNSNDQDYYMHRTRIYISKETAWDELNVGQYTGHQVEDYTNRRTAAPVRCVKNVDHNRVMAYITPKQYTIKPDQSEPIKFDLFAETFESELATATLSVAYHLKDDVGNEGPHQEHVVKTWDYIDNRQWSINDFSFDFNNDLFLLDNNGNKTTNVILSETTGNFRFILHVKSKDNINKISSTTIRIATNSVTFHEWKQQDSTVIIGEPIERKFRVTGDSRHSKVEMIQVDPSGIESSPIDITSYVSPAGDAAVYDYYYHTNNLLKFSTKGWNSVYFIITFGNGDVITTEKRWFKVAGISKESSPVTDVKDISHEKYYVIENVQHDNYFLYDYGSYMRANTTIDVTKPFKFIDNGDNTFKIQNMHTGDYVNRSGSDIYITAQTETAATAFTLTYSDSTFKIHVNNSYWRLQYNNWNVTSRNSNNNNQTRWRIYEVTEDLSGIDATPPSGNQ